MGSAPKAPDPVATASAQSGANRDTALSQSLLNQYDQVGPQGSITYNQTGQNSYVDSLTGKTVNTPKFTQTTTLSPEQQQLYNLNTQTETNLGNIGVEQSDKVRNILNSPFKLDNEATESRLYELGAKRLDPRFQQEQAALETNLLNRGIRPGSQAYKDAATQQGQDKNDAYNQLLLTGRSQAAQEALTERNQPLNEISALLSGSQVSMPQFASGGPQSGVAGTDYQGAVYNNYNAKNQNYLGKLNGLFGLGKAAIGGWASGGFGG